MSTRLETKYKDLSAKYALKSFDYQKQFCHLYAHRLAEMTRLLVPLVHERWGSEYAVKKLCDLREEQQDTCVIIGTVYKHQVHKPSILREISEENQLAPQPQREHYADAEDKLILEDELQRVRLFGRVEPELMATGVVCAVLGTIEEDGRFDVEQVLYYECGPQRSLRETGDSNSKMLVLISGLSQLQSHNYVDALNLFQHWLAQNICINKQQQLVRLIVAGNSVRSTAELRTPTLQVKSTDANNAVEAMRNLDKWFAVWSQTIPIDVMPGAYDPANFMLPQQPFHKCMFPNASKYTSFRSVSNPYECTVAETLVAGCSGQNIDDLLRSTTIEKPLQALHSTMTWGHVAPTAPDTLACYPYVDSDPFIMRECPHIYFAGNCKTYDTEMHISSSGKKTRLVCVPSFAETQSVAVVNLETLDCHQVCFSTNDD